VGLNRPTEGSKKAKSGKKGKWPFFALLPLFAFLLLIQSQRIG
jgi:hypothetical protein